jgi:hypothetical protein
MRTSVVIKAYFCKANIFTGNSGMSGPGIWKLQYRIIRGIFRALILILKGRLHFNSKNYKEIYCYSGDRFNLQLYLYFYPL